MTLSVVVRASFSLIAAAGITPFAAYYAASAAPSEHGKRSLLPGMPQVIDSTNIYSEARAGNFSAAVRSFPARIYVPNSGSNTVQIIDPATYKIIATFPVGREPQHVVPSWDLKTLWVASDLGDSLTRIDPATGKNHETIPVLDPYNMYNTPDGKFAIVVAERMRQLVFRDPTTMKVVKTVDVPCRGVDHMDFTADGNQAIATCEFSSELIRIDIAKQEYIDKISVRPGGMPQDIRTAPDGKVFYVADMKANGVYIVDPEQFKVLDFIETGKGTHGLYPSRDAKTLYVSNRGEGSVTLIDFNTRKIVNKWQIPGGGSPDMGGVSADGKVLWLAGRYHAEVYAFDTGDGHLLARIKTGKGPHGLCVYPQPGRYSLGHTGNIR
jgi:YVTN family beta-propeller protein